MNRDDDNTSIWGRSARGRTKAGVHQVSGDDTAWPRRRQQQNGLVGPGT